MISIQKVLGVYSVILCSLFLLLPFSSAQTNQTESYMKGIDPITFPENGIKCRNGEYIIQKVREQSWKIYYIENIVLITTLSVWDIDVTSIHSNNGRDQSLESFMSSLITPTIRKTVLVDRDEYSDSEIAPRTNIIHLLVNLYDREFISEQEAIEAIESNTLGESIKNLCRKIDEFPKEECVVYKKE